MDSSSRQTLLQLFEGIIVWRKKLDSTHKETTITWNEFHLSDVYDYILKLGNINSEFKLLKKLPSDSHISREMVASFVEGLHELFIVPKLHQLYDNDEATALKKTEHLIVFINFLLHLLYHKTELVDSFGAKTEVLKKELRFLLTFLGDTSLLGIDLEGVNNLLAEFEDVANEAGSLVFSFIFPIDRAVIAMRIDNTFVALLEHINLLKGKITTFLILLPHIRKSNMTPKIASVDSLFILDSLLYDLEDLMNREDDRITDVKGQIETLHQGLFLSKSLLKDIRVPRHLEIEELKRIVMQIRDVAYEAEYLINSFLIGDNPFWYFTLRFPDVINKIKHIGARLQEFKKSFDIGAFKVAMDNSVHRSLQAQTNSEVDDIEVGIEEKVTDILEQLVGGTKNLKIISIYGMPGLGKTTLARKLYSHPTVNYYFDKCSRCVVSQTYQRKKLLIDILISLRSELEKVKIMDMEEECIAECMYKSLKGIRYLIVMDDVWDSNVWDDLRRYFPNDENGSRILFTSRNKDVASPNGIIYKLPSLTNDQCWELLCKKVFQNKPCPPQLLRIGRNIAAYCRGLPLAVVVVAGILSTMDEEESTWEKVKRSLGSHIISSKNNSVMQMFELSYKHLPEHLKPCFLYFGAFPEDFEIPVKKLKCLWIAEGFISKQANKSAEDVGEEYLMELIDRSLVKVATRRSSDGGPKACVLHDLLLDWCLKTAKEENFLKSINNNDSIYTKHHRLHIHNTIPYPMAPVERFLPFGLHLRSLFVSHLDSPLLNIFHMKLLRVLDSSSKKVDVSHGDGIEHLVHLRYLATEYMPASIDRLVNLEFLTVHKLLLCDGQRSIPSVLQKLVKLRYLKVPLAKFDKDWNTSKTSNLEYLSFVEIHKLKDEKKLKCLPHLRKLKCVCQPFWDKKRGYRYPDLRFLTQLESLMLITSSGLFTSRASNRVGINFPKKIKKLTLDGLRRTWQKISTIGGLPNIGINFPMNIKKLTLVNLRLTWKKISKIGGLPNLQVLKLQCNAFVGNVWETKDREFQQLRFLEIFSSNLRKWSVASWEHFPKLQQLMLHACFDLEEIPSEMGEIATLQLIVVISCPKSVGESAIQIQEEQRDLGNEELRVTIDGVKT